MCKIKNKQKNYHPYLNPLMDGEFERMREVKGGIPLMNKQEWKDFCMEKTKEKRKKALVELTQMGEY